MKNHTRLCRVGLCSSSIDALRLRYWPGNSLKHPIDHTDVKVHMGVQAGTEAVNECDGALVQTHCAASGQWASRLCCTTRKKIRSAALSEPLGLVMDVTCGNGAFADTRAMADDLAHSIVAVANGAGLKTTALITDMNQVRGHSVGNALEVAEAIAYLTGDAANGGHDGRDPLLHAVTLALGAELLVLGGLATDTAAAQTQLQAALDGGAAAQHFARMVAALGGPTDLLERPQAHLVAAPVVVPVPTPRAGTLTALQTRQIGLAVVELGGGRRKAGDAIDWRVGLSRVAPLGQTLAAGEPLAWVHAADQASAERAVAQVQAACTISEDASLWQTAPSVIFRTENDR